MLIFKDDSLLCLFLFFFHWWYADITFHVAKVLFNKTSSQRLLLYWDVVSRGGIHLYNCSICRHECNKVSPKPWPTSDWESRLFTLISALVTPLFTSFVSCVVHGLCHRGCWTIGGGCRRCPAVQRSSSGHVYQSSRSKALFWRNTQWYRYKHRLIITSIELYSMQGRYRCMSMATFYHVLSWVVSTSSVPSCVNSYLPLLFSIMSAIRSTFYSLINWARVFLCSSCAAHHG